MLQCVGAIVQGVQLFRLGSLHDLVHKGLISCIVSGLSSRCVLYQTQGITVLARWERGLRYRHHLLNVIPGERRDFACALKVLITNQLLRRDTKVEATRNLVVRLVRLIVETGVLTCKSHFLGLLLRTCLRSASIS